MKKKTLALITLCAVLLTGCGTNFDITPADLQTYAAANDFTYTDLSEYYDYSYLDGVYLMEDNETVHVELLDFDTTENAYAWFSENIEHMKGLTGNFSGTISKTSGDYNFKVTSQDTVYHILFSGDKGIYALGYDKTAIDETLAGLNVIEE